MPRLIHERGGRTPQVYSVCEAASLVATGGFDAEIFTGPMPHDTASVKIVVEEAGGKVTDLFGNSQRYDCETKGAIISNGYLHNELVKLVKESGTRVKSLS